MGTQCRKHKFICLRDSQATKIKFVFSFLRHLRVQTHIKMNFKIAALATILFLIHCSVEVKSFEFIRKAVHKVVDSVHDIVHPSHSKNHHHDHGSNEPLITASTTATPTTTTPTTTTTAYPQIDIRSGLQQKPTSGDYARVADVDQIVFPVDATTTTTPAPGPDAIHTRFIVHAPCGPNMKSVEGQCRPVF